MRRFNRRGVALSLLVILVCGMFIGAGRLPGQQQSPQQQSPPPPPPAAQQQYPQQSPPQQENAPANQPYPEQQAPPPRQPYPNQQAPTTNAPYQTETPEQLQQLVAPIALYPDSLVASILAASTFPEQIREAYGWLAPRRSFTPQQIASDADKQNWDPSVKSLLPFPPVLQNLATNLSWTSELGDAYYNQQADVMAAIQEMRRQAKKNKTLKSNDQIHVTDKHGYISIEPANPEANTVYVPAYDPWLAYGYPIDPWPGWVSVPGVWWDGPGLYFGLGFGIGPFFGYGWGWPYWGIDWYHRGIFFGGVPYRSWGPAFFNRGYYYRGYPGFAHGYAPTERYGRGFEGRTPGYGVRSGPFSGFNHGGTVRGFSARGQSSFGGGFGGGGFRGGGFGGGGFHGGGGGRR